MAEPTEQQSARARIERTLAEFGLQSLADWYWNKYLSGEPEAQILLDLRKTPEYQARFPGMAELSRKGRAISEAEYIAIEKQYVQYFRQAGLPEGFYDSPDDFGRFIANEVSPHEMGARLDVARTAMYETPPQVRDELARLYGLKPGDIMAFLLDPTKALPIINNQFSAAAAAAASQASGYGALTLNEAEMLGLTGRQYADYEPGFDFLGDADELFAPIVGEQGGDIIGRDEQLGAAFTGNTAARRRIEQQAKRRVAQFRGGGGYAEDREGVSGLGSAAT